ARGRTRSCCAARDLGYDSTDSRLLDQTWLLCEDSGCYLECFLHELRILLHLAQCPSIESLDQPVIAECVGGRIVSMLSYHISKHFPTRLVSGQFLRCSIPCAQSICYHICQVEC